MSKHDTGAVELGTLGLALAAFAFVPVLVVAPLGTVALLVGASLFGIAARGGLLLPLLPGLRFFALVLVILLAWSALSILWSIDRTLSIVETARIAGTHGSRRIVSRRDRPAR